MRERKETLLQVEIKRLYMLVGNTILSLNTIISLAEHISLRNLTLSLNIPL